tara:strand:+ start:105 stop:815 length:711 start_codon:yes stop_codon:yes gene_type:complete
MNIKDFDIIYAMGCSFIQGAELNGRQLGNESQPFVKNRFTEILKEKIGVDFKNDGMGGAGHDKIIRRTFEYFENKKSQTLTILGLTEITRNELWSPKKNDWVKLNFSHGNRMFDDKVTSQQAITCNEVFKMYMKYFYSEEKKIEKLYRDLKMLEAYIKSKNPKNEIIYVNSLCKLPQDFYENFNFVNFIYQNGEKTSWGWWNGLDTDKFECEFGHPNERSHKVLADKVLDFVENNL